MNAGSIALIVAACTFTAGLAGLAIRLRLPDHHMRDDTRDVIKLVGGLISAMAALVLGLLISTANNFYNTQRSELELLAARVVQLDRMLAEYGPEAAPGRAMLKDMVVAGYKRLYEGDGTAATASAPFSLNRTDMQTHALDAFLGTLQPATPGQRMVLAQAQQISMATADQRLLMAMQIANPISRSFLAILVSWAALVFFGFGLIARMNLTVLAALAVGSLAVASAIFLILELGSPYSGMIRLSPAPLLRTIEFLNNSQTI